MLVHSVFFWLRPDLSPEQVADFRRAVEGLGAIATVKSIHVGTPAATEKRPVIDDTYSLALTLTFDDLPAQNVYQVDPIHVAFVDTYKSFWLRVQIYDAD